MARTKQLKQSDIVDAAISAEEKGQELDAEAEQPAAGVPAACEEATEKADNTEGEPSKGKEKPEEASAGEPCEPSCEDHSGRYSALLALKEMTDTKAWREHYQSWMDDRELHYQSLLTAEKPRDIQGHQEAVRFIDRQLLALQKPIEMFNRYAYDYPLFSTHCGLLAHWNPELGAVELDVPPKGDGRPTTEPKVEVKPAGVDATVAIEPTKDAEASEGATEVQQ
jgi:hypothetical protein